MIINLFKHGSEEFIQFLELAAIEYRSIKPPYVVATNAPDTIEVIRAALGLALAPSIATVLVQWQKTNPLKKMLTENTGRIKTIEGCSEEAERLLQIAKSIAAIQTQQTKGCNT